MYLRSTCPTGAYLRLSGVKIVLGFKHCAVKALVFSLGAVFEGSEVSLEGFIR